MTNSIMYPISNPRVTLNKLKTKVTVSKIIVVFILKTHALYVCLLTKLIKVLLL